MATAFLEFFLSFWKTPSKKKCCECKEECTYICPCHTKGLRCIDCPAQRCRTRPCCQCHNEGSECKEDDNCACRSTHTSCSANCLVETCANKTTCCQCHNEGSECKWNDNCACRSTDTRCSANCLVETCANNKMPHFKMKCCGCKEQCTYLCPCQTKCKLCNDCRAKRCSTRRCCQCHEEGLECNRNDNCACRSTKTRCSPGCLVESCANNKISLWIECCACNDESECNTDNCECHIKGKPCKDCPAKGCTRRCCQCHEEGSECKDNCACRSKKIRCFANCLAESCANNKMSLLVECCACNDESECNTDNCECHIKGKPCKDCPAKGCTRRCCQCHEKGLDCKEKEKVSKKKDKEKDKDSKEKYKCACRSKKTRCYASCLAESCANNKISFLKECCACNDESECNTDNCECHIKGKPCKDCPAKGCTRRCCQCHKDGSMCKEDDNCACRSTKTRCSANCLVKNCANNKMCCHCRQEGSECRKEDNCACRSKKKKKKRCPAKCPVERCANKRM